MPLHDTFISGKTGLKKAVDFCRQNKEFLQQLKKIYAEVDKFISESNPKCLGGGVCCKFDLMGHRLYLSVGELAVLTEKQPANKERYLEKRCPYQLGPRCIARENRPLGCRTFFCDKISENLFQTTYERFHREIQQLTQTHCLPYAYVELTFGLMQLF